MMILARTIGRIDVPCEDRTTCFFFMIGPSLSSRATVLSILLLVAPVSMRATTVFCFSPRIVTFSTRPRTGRLDMDILLFAGLLKVSSASGTRRSTLQ